MTHDFEGYCFWYNECVPKHGFWDSSPITDITGYLILGMIVGLGLYLHLTFRKHTRAEIENYFLNWK